MDIVAQAKNVGAVLGTASLIGYVYGYLALRARARALGTDPGFKLVDEVYVFAGFRVLFITLVALLLLAPVILLVRWGATWLAAHLPRAVVQPSQWLLLVALAIMTLLSLSFILSANSVLLQEGPLTGSRLAEAVLGEAAPLRLLLIFAVTLFVVLSALWLQSRLAGTMGAFEWLLALVVALQLIVLPIYHGVLFADRQVRVLDADPGRVPGLGGSLAIIDRTAEHVTLLALDGAGKRRLATVEIGDLNAIPIKKVVPLREFVSGPPSDDLERTRAAGIVSGLGLRVVDVSEGEQAHSGQELPSGGSEVETGFFASLIEDLAFMLDAIGALGDSEVDSGELWVAELDAAGSPAARKRIGGFDDLAWPVASPDPSIYFALRRGRVVRLDAKEESMQILDEDTSWSKLLGVRDDGTILGLVWHQGEIRPAMLPPGGARQMALGPLSKESKKALANLRQETRSYAGDRTLLVDRSERGGRGFDVFLRTNEETFNLSDCGHDFCGQASLAPDLRRAVFIRQRRY